MERILSAKEPSDSTERQKVRYRLYIDEVGSAGLSKSRDPNERYLSLTGIAIEHSYVRDVLSTELESMKSRYFGGHPDDPIVLHRKELMHRSYPFGVLRDNEIEAKWNSELLDKISCWQYTCFTVVLDKEEHYSRYTVWRYHPYHYCMHVLLERYVLWLERKNAVGDVMAESRGGKEDGKLKESFARIVTEGSSFVDSSRFDAALTSGQLKVKLKDNNIAGLQLADLLAHPAFKAALSRRNKQALEPTFGGKIAATLEAEKYDRDPRGHIDGWGRKWLP